MDSEEGIFNKILNEDIEILIVEDSLTQAEQLHYILEKNSFHVLAARDGKEALALMQSRRPVIVVTDVLMPVMDGYELCRQIRDNANFNDIPVILLTSLSDPSDVIRGLQCGANNFITKPYDEKHLLVRIYHLLANLNLRKTAKSEMGINIFFQGENYFINSDRLQILDLLLSTYESAYQKNNELIKLQDELKGLNEQLEQRVAERTALLMGEIARREQVEEELRQSYGKLQSTLEGTIQTLVSAIEMGDPYTAGHQRRVAQVACAIAGEMGLPGEQVEGIRMAGLIHDIGKITVPAQILNRPGRLSDLENSFIKTHPQVGYDILKTIEFPWPVARIVLQHHERMNGSGYPEGLSGDEILIEARIIAVADVVEAMSSHRPYRPALGVDKALEEISQNKGLLYDPESVDACLKLLLEKELALLT